MIKQQDVNEESGSSYGGVLPRGCGSSSSSSSSIETEEVVGIHENRSGNTPVCCQKDRVFFSVPQIRIGWTQEPQPCLHRTSTMCMFVCVCRTVPYVRRNHQRCARRSEWSFTSASKTLAADPDVVGSPNQVREINPEFFFSMRCGWIGRTAGSRRRYQGEGEHKRRKGSGGRI